uniref:Fanconi-associated nuclease n=1 Tax=Kalanchoe fedtschenkoi TaxID=63787 RepID=A0A7N0TSX0_KALFE
MLKGRESLIRLIGKRRTLSGDLSVILSALPPLVRGEKVTAVGDEEEDVASTSLSASYLVHCPVCGTAMRGGDQAINAHLDFCLVKGKKRKLTQSTLFQLKYSPKAKFESNSPSNNTLGFVNQMGPTAVSFIKDSDCQKSENLCVHATYEDQSVGNLCDEKVDALYQDKMPLGSNITTSQELNQLILETLIVGRRFSIEKELRLGTSIILVRDPNNIKDCNAIKVLSADPGCGKVFGYISRDLSKYLSPLIEKFSLSFEGCVTSAPEHIFGPVPIRISCLSPASSNMIDSEVFRSLWANVVHVVESAKTNPTSGKTKYQENLCLLIKEVLQDNRHLFTVDELSFLESFLSLSNDCQRLFIRLYMRKGPWFRLSTMSYVEILNIEEATKELSERGYFRLSSAEVPLDDLKRILNVLAIPDLRFLQNIVDKRKNLSSRKQDIIASLVSSYEGRHPCLPAVLIKKYGVFVTISETAESLFWRAQRLFFLNGEQDLSAFLFADLQIIKYPAYNCITTDKIFRNRSDMLSFEEAVKVAQIMDQSIEENDSITVAQCIKMSELGLSCFSEHAIQSETTFLSLFSASWVYSKVVLLGISFLEKEHRYIDAITLLRRLLSVFTCDSRRGYWTLRLSIDLEHIGRPTESLIVAENGLLDPWIRAGSRLALQRRILRLGKPPRRWKIPSFSMTFKRKLNEVHLQGRPLNCEAGMKSRFYGYDGEQCGVEELALQYYSSAGGQWKGVQSESGIWLNIFGLLMWDIIFSDVPNVFCSRFQTAPLDLDTDNFYISRKDKIESHLQNIQAGMAEEILIASWQSNEGTSCKGVNWDRHSLCDLRAVVTCVGGSCLASLCRHLAQDYGSWSSGMPDLVLWRFHGNYTGEAKLVEVKGPRDRLSEQQQAWLLFLMDCGFNTEVCRVSHEGLHNS